MAENKKGTFIVKINHTQGDGGRRVPAHGFGNDVVHGNIVGLAAHFRFLKMVGQDKDVLPGHQPVQPVDGLAKEGSFPEHVQELFGAVVTGEWPETGSAAAGQNKGVLVHVCFAGMGVKGRSESSETAFSAGVVQQSRFHVPFAKVRPQRVRHVNFRVADLPEKKVGDAHFSGGADKQVRFRHAGGVQVLAEQVFRYGVRMEFPSGDFFRYFPGGGGYFPTAAVGNGQNQIESGVSRSSFQTVLKKFPGAGWKTGEISYGVEAHAFFHHLVETFFQEFVQKEHQRAHFRFRAVPVFRGKGVKSEPGNIMGHAEVRTALHRIRSRPVACLPRQMTAVRPAAVAVHDAGDVNRQFFLGNGKHRQALLLYSNP